MKKILIITCLIFGFSSTVFANEKTGGDKWKDTYFEKHPEADTNKDGELSWPEYKTHKNAAKKPAPANDKAEKNDGEKWKDTYFKKHPEADTNKDGKLSWPEFNQHKKKNQTNNI